MTLNIKKNYLTRNRCYQTGTRCKKIGIQLHTIGTGQGTAQSVADYWNQGAVSACVHYVVDCDTPGKVLQLLLSLFLLCLCLLPILICPSHLL